MEQGLQSDPLTGARSRQGFYTELEDILEAATVLGHNTSLMILDVDHFKSINDVFGHARGDQILVELVSRITDLVRGSDSLYRYGGDEFILVLPNTNRHQATGLAERLLGVIKGRLFGGEPPLSVSVSIGLASANPGEENPKELFEQADLNLYAAKRAGRGRLADVSDQVAEVSGRLLEREAASQTAHRFLKTLPQLRRGALIASGPEKAGHSGFLRETSQIAKLLGYRVVQLVGRSAYATHPYGALLDGLGLEEGELAIAERLPALLERLAQADKGVVWCIDRLDSLDAASLQTLQRLMQASEGPVMGLVVVGTAPARVEAWLGGMARDQVSLTPFSLGATKVFVRTWLHWEPPEDFVSWLWQKSAGLPGRMVQLLGELRHSGALIAGSGGYMLNPDYPQRLENPKDEVPHLPKPSSSLIGRDREVVALKRLLQERRLVSVTGQGGMGKTHLVSQVALEVEHLYRDGAIFISLASLAEASGLPVRLAQELGLKPGGEVTETLERYFTPREMLLVLDNLEHLLDGVEFLRPLLRKAPGLTILTTSRERLGLPEEWVYELTGLGVASVPEEALASGACRLLLQAARRVEPGLNLDGAELQAAQRICQLVEGMPLGLELAAAWVKVLPLSEIAAEIEASQGFLSLPESESGRPERHYSLAAAFESSWCFLDAAQQQILAKLSLFRGGFDRQAAQTVALASVSTLLSLISLSLLKRDPQHPGRYQMHELLRQFARSKLEAWPQVYAQARQAQAEFYLDYAERIEPELKGQRQVESLNQVALELDNLRIALHFFEQQGDALRGLRLMVALEWFFYVRGLFKEGVQWLQGFLQGDVPELLRAKGLRALASLTKELSRLPESRSLFQQSLELFRRVGHPEGIASTLHMLGVLARDSGQYVQALAYLEESLQLRREAGDLWGVGTSLNDLAIVQAYSGQTQQAKELFQQSLEVKRQIGDLQGVAYATGNLAHFIEQPEEQIAAFEESLVLKRKLNDRQGIANTLQSLGSIYTQQKNYPLAQLRLLEAISLFLEVGNTMRLASTLVSYALLLQQAGYSREALLITAAVLSWQEATQSNLFPGNRESLEQLKAQGQALAHYDQTWQEGQQMSLQAAAVEVINSAGNLSWG